MLEARDRLPQGTVVLRPIRADEEVLERVGLDLQLSDARLELLARAQLRGVLLQQPLDFPADDGAPGLALWDDRRGRRRDCLGGYSGRVRPREVVGHLPIVLALDLLEAGSRGGHVRLLLLGRPRTGGSFLAGFLVRQRAPAPQALPTSDRPDHLWVNGATHRLLLYGDLLHLLTVRGQRSAPELDAELLDEGRDPLLQREVLPARRL